jgi:hypothetical protein
VIFVIDCEPYVTVVAWHEVEEYSAVTPTTRTRFDWFATVCDHASVVPADALVPEAEASWVIVLVAGAAELEVSTAIALAPLASLRSTLAVIPVMTFPDGIEKPKFVASRFALDELAAIDAVAYELLLETMFEGLVHPEPVAAGRTLELAGDPMIVRSPPTSTEEVEPVIFAPFFRIRQWFAATEPGIVTVSTVMHWVVLSE